MDASTTTIQTVLGERVRVTNGRRLTPGGADKVMRAMEDGKRYRMVWKELSTLINPVIPSDPNLNAAYLVRVTFPDGDECYVLNGKEMRGLVLSHGGTLGRVLAEMNI